MNNRIDLTPETVEAALKADEFYMHASTNFDGVAHLSIVIEASLTDTTSSRDIDATDYEWVLSADNATLAELCRQLRAEAVMMFDLLDDMEPGDRRRVAELLALWPDDTTEEVEG